MDAGLATAAAVIFLGSAASRVLGLVREQMAAGAFGAGDRIAAFTIADNLNTLIFDLLVNGMLQAALVPVLAVLAIAGLRQTERFRQVTGTLMLLAVSVAMVAAAVGIGVAPGFVSMMTALTSDSDIRGAGTRELAIECTRIILISLPFLAAATVLTAALYAVQRPAGPAIGTACRNGAIVVAIAVFSSQWGVKSMAAGVVAGAVLMFGIQIVAAMRAGAMPILTPRFRDPEIIRVFRLFLPVFVGLLVSTAVVILDRNLAWGAQDNAVGAMRYATTLVQLVLGLVAAAVSLAALPRLAQSFAGGDAAGFNEGLYRALALVTILIIPAVFALAALGTPIVDLLFEHGETDARAARLIVVALLAYLPGHLLAAYDQVLIFAFYARQNTILPVTVGVVASMTYAVFALALINRFEMVGLVVANSAQLSLHTTIMIWLAKNRFGTAPIVRLVDVLVPTLASAAAMAVVGWAVYRVLDEFLPGWTGLAAQLRELFLVAVPLGISAVVYLWTMRGLRVQALQDLTDAAAGRIAWLKTRP